MVKTIVVTGGNRGIGKEICRQLAVMGHKIVLCSRDLSKGEKAALDIDAKVDVQSLDVINSDSINNLVKYLAVYLLIV